ncbi:MAG: hypothetical protein IT290_06400 [Deltaproteobacteria bacterium]|nr:hypothetical protein [Deltaproteobacteria bacterium]
MTFVESAVFVALAAFVASVPLFATSRIAKRQLPLWPFPIIGGETAVLHHIVKDATWTVLAPEFLQLVQLWLVLSSVLLVLGFVRTTATDRLLGAVGAMSYGFFGILSYLLVPTLPSIAKALRWG